MGEENTDLKDNSNPEEEITANRNLNQPQINDDSDSDFEQADGWGGYMPLAQNPNDGDPFYSPHSEDSDEENPPETTPSSSSVDSASNNPPIPLLRSCSSTLIEEVWSKAESKAMDIEMNEKKIDLVKQVMSTIQLPAAAIPNWAQNVPEDQWKEHLLQRLNK